MGEFKVRYSALARQDLRRVISYVAVDLQSSLAASQLLDAFDAAVSSLAEMPGRNRLVSDQRLTAVGYRRLAVKQYLIVYRVDETAHEVLIVRVLHGRQDWEAML